MLPLSQAVEAHRMIEERRAKGQDRLEALGDRAVDRGIRLQEVLRETSCAARECVTVPQLVCFEKPCSEWGYQERCCSDCLCAWERSTYSLAPRPMSAACSSLTSLTRLAGMPTMRLWGRELAALGDDGTGRDDGAFADLRAVEDRGAHADEAVVPDLAPVHDRVVPDDASLADDRRIAWVGVQYAAVLDVGTAPPRV